MTGCWSRRSHEQRTANLRVAPVGGAALLRSPMAIAVRRLAVAAARTGHAAISRARAAFLTRRDLAVYQSAQPRRAELRGCPARERGHERTERLAVAAGPKRSRRLAADGQRPPDNARWFY